MSNSPVNEYQLGINEIQKFIPHRAPFLLLDRILAIYPTGDLKDHSSNGKEGSRVVALKAVTFNEPFFQGHFPGFAVMPGVLICEAMAQATVFTLYPFVRDHAKDFSNGFEVALLGMDKMRFRKPVVPGDVMVIDTTVLRTRGKIWSFQCTVTVDGKLVAEGELLANLAKSGLD